MFKYANYWRKLSWLQLFLLVMILLQRNIWFNQNFLSIITLLRQPRIKQDQPWLNKLRPYCFWGCLPFWCLFLLFRMFSFWVHIHFLGLHIIIIHIFGNFGTSVRRSSRSAFGRSTGNDVSGHYKRHYFLFFFLFFFFFFSVVYSSHRRSARIKKHF